MELSHQASLLREFVGRVSGWPIEQFLKLDINPATEDVGTPTVEGVQSYCSLEAQLLQILEPAVPRLVHVSVHAWGSDHSLGADLFIREGEPVEWNGQIYEFIDGVPRLLDR